MPSAKTRVILFDDPTRWGADASLGQYVAVGFTAPTPSILSLARETLLAISPPLQLT